MRSWEKQAYYLEHVCIAVVGVLHHHHLDSRQSVRDAMLVFVAYGLNGGGGEKVDEYKIIKKRREKKKKRKEKINVQSKPSG